VKADGLWQSTLRLATSGLASIVLAAFAMTASAASDLDAKFARLEKADAVVEGAAKDPKFVLYVLFDANCLYCHLTWKAVQPY